MSPAHTQPKKAGQHAARPDTAFVHAVKAAGLTPAAGKGAVEGKYSASIVATKEGAVFTGSVDLDTQFKAAESRSNRWDYGVGIKDRGQPECAIWIEPHSGTSTGEVTVILAKLKWLQAKLESPTFHPLKVLTAEAIRQGKTPYVWLASGKVGIRAGSREARQLASAGMRLPMSQARI